MAHEYHPIIGDWYRNGTGQSFEIVAVDENDESIEIQYYDGDIEEVDFETWASLNIEHIEPPEDWTGPFGELEKDDMGYSDITSSTNSWSNPLDKLD